MNMIRKCGDWLVLADDESVDRTLRNWKIKSLNDFYRKNLPEALDLCKQKRTALDIGANYGLISQILCKQFKKVHSFEISPLVSNLLERNMKNFGFNNVVTHHYGVADNCRKVKLNFKIKNTVATYVEDNDSEYFSSVKNLDSLKLEDVDFIKIDVEGYEQLVVKGGLKLIEKYKPVIHFESRQDTLDYHGFENITLDLLKPLGYIEITDPSKTMDRVVYVP